MKQSTFVSHSSDEPIKKNEPDLDEFGKKISALPDKIKLFQSMFDKKPIFLRDFRKREKAKVIVSTVSFFLKLASKNHLSS